jgi:hypothetical protein
MASNYKSHPFEIPAFAREVKDNFRNRSSANAEIARVHKHLEDGGYTFTYPGTPTPSHLWERLQSTSTSSRCRVSSCAPSAKLHVPVVVIGSASLCGE